jgi:UDP-glucuronate 4-epimerase
MNRILVTGAAGFIGYHLCKSLISKGFFVVGIDNINNYYDVRLKYNRLEELGIDKNCASQFHEVVASSKFINSFSFIRMNIEDRKSLPKIFKNYKFDVVCNLAAQAGVRYSIENPEAYIDSNIVGFLNVMECCRNNKIKHFIYASSSSVYGLNNEIPFKVTDNVESPISLYAATKKSNELIAHSYSHLYKIPTTGLRFFTVYGPWGRPDMAYFLFADAIVNNRPINVFNNGNMERDFTFISDIIDGILKIVIGPLKDRLINEKYYKIYNIGNNKSIKLSDFIDEIEKNLSIKSAKNMMAMQPGDVVKTWANVDQLIADYDYSPNTTINFGVEQFIKWYKEYFNVH